MEEREFFSESDIVEQLLGEGFEADEIDAAFTWMERLSLEDGRPAQQTTLEQPTHRIFTGEEEQLISCEARGFLVRLRSLGILTDNLQEEIIDKATRLNDDEVTLKEIKALTALTLFSHSHDDWRREVDCFMEDDWSRLYH
jgi:Smg protein